MTTMGTNNATVEDEIYGVIKTMIAKEKKLQQAEANKNKNKNKNRANEETPSPRGVADVDVSFEQDQRKAYIEHTAQTFLGEVLTLTLTIVEHNMRMTILPGDVRLALEYFDKIHGKVDEVKAIKEVEDEDDDEDWYPEIGDETDDEELEDEEEIDETDDEELEDEEEIDETDDEDEEEIDEEGEEGDEEAEEVQATGFSSVPVPTGRFSVKEFKECLLWPHLIRLRSFIPVKNEAVEMLSESMFYFLNQKFS